MMAPLTIIDCVVVHELCHVHHSDHTQAFWNEVGFYPTTENGRNG